MPKNATLQMAKDKKSAGSAARKVKPDASAPTTPNKKGAAKIKAFMKKTRAKQARDDAEKRMASLRAEARAFMLELAALTTIQELAWHYRRIAKIIKGNERRDGAEKNCKSVYYWSGFKFVREGSKVHAKLAERFNGVPLEYFPYVYETKSKSQLKKACFNDWHGTSTALQEKRWEAKMNEIEKKYGSWEAYQKMRIEDDKERTHKQYLKYVAWVEAQEQESEAREQARASASASTAELIDLTKEEAKDEVDLTMIDE
jgi:hypothetical protein